LSVLAELAEFAAGQLRLPIPIRGIALPFLGDGFLGPCRLVPDYGRRALRWLFRPLGESSGTRNFRLTRRAYLTPPTAERMIRSR